MWRGFSWVGTGLLMLALGAPGIASGATLHDQIDLTAPESTTSQDFETANNAFDAVTADDFTVPTGETWKLDGAIIRGKSKGASTTSTVNVTIFADAGGLPGTSIFSQQLQAPGYPHFQLDLSGVPLLTPGTYWLGVQAVLAGGNPNVDPQQWFWFENSEPFGNPAVFRNPGGGFNFNCPTFEVRSTCLPTHTAPDQSFSLSGTRTDVAPPKTKITQSPSKLKLHGDKRTATATFKFKSNEAGSTFKCRIDKGAKKSCTSPFKAKLKKGLHTFAVTAKDPAGNADPTPATAKVRVTKAG